MLTCQTKYLAFEETIRRVPAAKPTGLFRTSISQTTKKEKRAIPFVITSAVREVERRGITEVGIYRVSGSATDMARLKVTFKTFIRRRVCLIFFRPKFPDKMLWSIFMMSDWTSDFGIILILSTFYCFTASL